jgi:FixJ family two-component response regulator
MTNRVLIAIVDDNQYLREGLADLVRSLGYTAASFASGHEYLASGLVHETTCLITDLQMPDMTGADLQDLLIAHGLDIPIIFVTANRDESVRARALSAGAFGFLSKPFDEQWLRGHIADALKWRREQRDLALGIVRHPQARSAA